MKIVTVDIRDVTESVIDVATSTGSLHIAKKCRFPGQRSHLAFKRLKDGRLKTRHGIVGQLELVVDGDEVLLAMGIYTT